MTKNKNPFWKKIIFSSMVALALFPLARTLAAEGINKQIPFYGVMKYSNGNVVPDGNYDAVFKIYNAPTGGTPLWTGNHTAANGNPIEVKVGNFVVFFGSGTGNTMTLDFKDDTYYVGVTVGADSEMTPRQRVGAAAYSFNADAVDGSHVLKVTASPEGSQFGSVGDIALDTMNNKLYIKSSGTNTNTGWAEAGALSDGSVTSAKITDGTIVTADMADGAVTSAKIADDTIMDADVNTAANIALSKLANGLNIVTALAAPSGSNANGGNIANNVLTLSLADGTNPGLISTSTQAFAGAKTFANNVELSSGLVQAPINPTLVTIFSTGFRRSNEIVVSGKYLYSASLGGNSLQIIDISNPTNPTIVSTLANEAFNSWTNKVAVSGKYAYVTSADKKSLTVVDIANPKNPTIVGSLVDTTAFNGISSVVISGKYAYVTGWSNDSFHTVDVSNPVAPVIVGSITGSASLDGANDFVIYGKYAYVVTTNNDSVQIIDISNPATPTIVGGVSDNVRLDSATSIAVYGKYAYVSSYNGIDNNDGFTIIDISNPTSPTILSSLPWTTISGGTFVAVSGKYAYVTDNGNEGLRVIDISNPSSPTVVATVLDPINSITSPIGVVISGKYAYMTGGNSSGYLAVIDLGGVDASVASIGNLDTSDINVSNNVKISNNLSIAGGLVIGNGGLLSQSGAIISGGLKVNGVTTVGGSILPSADNTYDLGSSTMRFRDLYLGPNSLHLGDQVLSNSSGSLVWSGTSIEATASATSSTELKLSELSTNGLNYTGFKSPDALAANVLYTLPSADGTLGQMLATDGAGALSWATSTQTFATGKGGMDFNVSSVSGAHTFNLPDASLTSRGVLTTGLQFIAGDKNFANDLMVDGKLIAREALLRSKDISFATAVNYPSAAAANGGDLADFNNDGYLDLVTPSYADNSIAISVNLNNGNGTFAAKTDYAGGRMMDARTGDFDGDGDIDIVSVSRSGSYSVFINNSNGTFAAAVNYTGVGGPDLMLVHDFNGDGKLDFVSSVFGTNTVAVYMGNGNGTFAGGVSYTTSIGTADGFDIADITGDGKEDLAVVSSAGISVLPGNSNGTFGTAITKTTGTGSDMNSVNVADINNDGKLDLVAGSLNQLFVYLGTGGGNFADAVNYGTGGATKYAMLHDFDGDGDMDVVAASFTTPGQADILTNNGAGVFTAHSNYVAGGEALIPKVADVNNDGQKDLIVINQTGDTSVLINNAAPVFYAQSSSGNVGIGTSAPSSKLHVAGVTTVGGSILPSTDNTYDIGSSTMRFRDLYLGPNSLHIGDQVLSNSSGSLVWSGSSIEATASATSSTELKLTELSTNGLNYTGFKSPDALATNVLYTLPSTDGTNGQSLVTNGSGGLSWASSAGISIGKTSTVHHSVGTALPITTAHNNAEIHAESTGGFTIDGASFTEDTFGATIVNTGAVSVNLTPSNFVGSFLRDGTTDAGFATLSIEPDTAYKLTVTNNGGSKFLNVIKFAAGGGSSQWITSGSNVYYDTGNVAIGTSTPSASAKLLISGAVAAATAGSSENEGLVTTGGTVDTTTVTGETIVSYTATTGTNTFTPPTGVASVQVLVVAGGAGGGSGVGGDLRGGGGGAGGLISNNTFAVTSGTPVTVTVGAGGAAAANGSDSVFSTLVADGGGRGGSGAQTGFAGGSGGGGGAPSGATASFTGGTGTVGEGNDGGTGGTDGTTYRSGGGGGGAGAVGGAGSANGTGGAGTASTITGASVTYAGGGGGGGPSATNGGTGGGGRGGAYPGGAATAGTANTGGGGGGAANGVAGAAGGSGVVIVRFVTVAAVPAGVASDNALLRVIDTGSVISSTLAFFEGTSGSGCIVAGGTGLTCSSDIRLKKNVETMNSALGNVLALKPVTYDWRSKNEVDVAGFDPYATKDSATGNNIGFIAQDVEQIFPGLVVADPNGKKTLAYDKFAPILVKAIQELNDKVDTLEGNPSGEKSLSQMEKELLNFEIQEFGLKLGALLDFEEDGLLAFDGDITFKGRLAYEDEDMAGYAEIPQGKEETKVEFKKEYNFTPIIQVVPLGNYSANYWVEESETDAKSFKIKINSPLDKKARFSWIALAVKNPKNSETDTTGSQIGDSESSDDEVSPIITLNGDAVMVPAVVVE